VPASAKIGLAPAQELLAGALGTIVRALLAILTATRPIYGVMFALGNLENLWH
jgi:hypothetical protein